MYSLLFDLDKTANLANEYWGALKETTLSSRGIEINEVEQVRSILWSIGTYRPDTLKVKTKAEIEELLQKENEMISAYQVQKPGEFMDGFSLELESELELNYRMSAEHLAQIQVRLNQALDLVEKYWPEARREIQAIQKAYMWYERAENSNRAYSSPKNFGFTFLNHEFFSVCPIPTLATQLVHEAAHQILFVESAIDPLIPNDYAKEIYSPFRGNQRPAIGALHALMAMARMLMWMEKLSVSSNAEDQAECKELQDLLIPQHREAIEVFESVEFSPRGIDLMNSFKQLQSRL